MGQPATKDFGPAPKAKYPRLVDEPVSEPSSVSKKGASTSPLKTIAIGFIAFCLAGFVIVGIWQGWLTS